MKRQLATQAKTIAKLQEQILVNQSILLGQHAMTNDALGLMQPGMTAPAVQQPTGARGDMPFDQQRALMSSIERLRAPDQLKVFEIAGVGADGELDLQSLDRETLWKLQDFCDKAKRATERGRKPRRPRNRAAELQEASAATEQRLAAVREARALLMSDAETSSAGWQSETVAEEEEGEGEGGRIDAGADFDTLDFDTPEDAEALCHDLDLGEWDEA